MPIKRSVEIFSAGCYCCADTVELVRAAACPSCEVTVWDVQTPAAAERARRLGVRSVPAVAVDGKLADCCAARGPELATLRAAGLGGPPA